MLQYVKAAYNTPTHTSRTKGSGLHYFLVPLLRPIAIIAEHGSWMAEPPEGIPLSCGDRFMRLQIVPFYNTVTILIALSNTHVLVRRGHQQNVRDNQKVTISRFTWGPNHPGIHTQLAVASGYFENQLYNSTTSQRLRRMNVNL